VLRSKGGEDGRDYSESGEVGARSTSGEVHLPSEEVTVMSVIRNLDRTLMKVRWQAGECVVFPAELEEILRG
jgi:hypothetical protein